MAKKTKIFIGSNGEVHLVYNDKVASAIDGTKEVTRASNVEFNHNKQLWEATTPDGVLLCSDQSRDACLQEEVRIVENNLQEQLSCQMKQHKQNLQDIQRS